MNNGIVSLGLGGDATALVLSRHSLAVLADVDVDVYCPNGITALGLGHDAQSMLLGSPFGLGYCAVAVPNTNPITPPGNLGGKQFSDDNAVRHNADSFVRLHPVSQNETFYDKVSSEQHELNDVQEEIQSVRASDTAYIRAEVVGTDVGAIRQTLPASGIDTKDLTSLLIEFSEAEVIAMLMVLIDE